MVYQLHLNNTVIKKKKKEKKCLAGQHRQSAQQTAPQDLGPSQPHRCKSCSLPDLPELWGRECQVERLEPGPAVHFLKTLRKALQSMAHGQEPGLPRSKDRSLSRVHPVLGESLMWPV